MTNGTSFSIAAFAVFLGACASASTENTATNGAQIRACASGSTVEGIDVSTYEGTIDWEAVKNAGIAFAFARVSDGTTHPDATFDRNWAEIKSHGLVRGVYQFYRPGEDPIAQADLLLSKIGQLGPGDLPPVLDLEEGDGFSSASIVSGAAQWLDRVQAATGRKPMIYTASGFWDTLSGASRFGSYPLWVANYGATCPSVPDSWSSWQFWQYSESGRVAGISGDVDKSVWNGTIEQLRSFAQGEAAPGEAIEVYWSRTADGHYELRALAPSDVVRVDYHVDGYPIGAATKSNGANFPTQYTFTTEALARAFEVNGFNASDVRVAHGIGLIDVTPDTAVYIREMGPSLYEVGLERAPSGVAFIEARVDGVLLTDSVSGLSRTTRGAVRSKLLTTGPRGFAVTTYAADGSVRGTLHRDFTVE